MELPQNLLRIKYATWRVFQDFLKHELFWGDDKKTGKATLVRKYQDISKVYQARFQRLYHRTGELYLSIFHLFGRVFTA